MEPGPIDDDRIPQFIAHLEVRTAHVRNSLRDEGKHLLASIGRALCDPATLVSIARKTAWEDSPAFGMFFEVAIQDSNFRDNLVRSIPAFSSHLSTHVDQSVKTGTQQGTFRLDPLRLISESPRIVDFPIESKTSG